MEPIEVDLLIDGGTVLTMDPYDRVCAPGSVAVRGNRIVRVGPREEFSNFRAERVIDATHMAVLPGLIDTYGHAGHGLIKGLCHPALDWPSEALYFHSTDKQWWYAEGLLSGLERLNFGVTCGFTVVGATPARIDDPVFAEQQARAVAELGVRGVIGVGPPDPYVSHLSEPWSGSFWNDGKKLTRTFTYEEAVRNTAAVIDSLDGSAEGRLRVAVHFPYLFGRVAEHLQQPFNYTDECVPKMIDQAEEMRELADRHQVLLHTHIFRGSVSHALEKFGVERVQRLMDGSGVAFAHSNGLTEIEIDVLGAAQAGICVVPFTHENIWYGACPVVELLDAGAVVSVSTDGAAPYCSYDLLVQVSRAIWGQWSRLGDLTALPPGKVLRMITIDAARVLRLDHEIGSLEAGKRADIILINLDRPHLTPQVMLPRQLAFYATGQDVDTVLVDGKILKQHGQVIAIDEAAVLDLAREQASVVFSRFDVTPWIRSDRAFWHGSHYSR
jgi:cytosine/adenosine deaminase-related metal-dependent hydrolase